MVSSQEGNPHEGCRVTATDKIVNLIGKYVHVTIRSLYCALKSVVRMKRSTPFEAGLPLDELSLDDLSRSCFSNLALDAERELKDYAPT